MLETFVVKCPFRTFWIDLSLNRDVTQVTDSAEPGFRSSHSAAQALIMEMCYLPAQRRPSSHSYCCWNDCAPSRSSASSAFSVPPSDSTAYLIGINRIINAAAVIRSNAPQLLIQIREINFIMWSFWATCRMCCDHMGWVDPNVSAFIRPVSTWQLVRTVHSSPALSLKAEVEVMLDPVLEHLDVWYHISFLFGHKFRGSDREDEREKVWHELLLPHHVDRTHCAVWVLPQAETQCCMFYDTSLCLVSGLLESEPGCLLLRDLPFFTSTDTHIERRYDLWRR